MCRVLQPWVTCLAVAAALGAAAAAAPAGEVPPPIYRVFLKDGTTLAAYGEWVRVGDRVVFSITVGEGLQAPLHLASVPADAVDWPATEQYRDGLRAAQYAATRGDQDFAALSDEVARLLNDAAKATDPARRLASVEDARRRLTEWPAAHFGYRTDEVRQVLALVDEVVSDLRAARGDTTFDLNLVAWAVPPPTPHPIPPPSLREAVSQALRLARLAESPVERVSLLRTASSVLDQRRRSSPEPWVSGLRRTVDGELRRELEVDERYAELQSRELRRASRSAERGDVRGVEKSMARVRSADERLGATRPDAVRALMVVLEERLDAARRLRLARDQWAVKSEALGRYQKASKGPLADFLRVRSSLDDIKALAGPDLGRLARVERTLSAVQARLSVLDVPVDLRQPHALALSAAQLAGNAARLRRQAVESGEMRPAWDASAAAAGALMLFERATSDLRRALTPP
jgi:hypothetical protein